MVEYMISLQLDLCLGERCYVVCACGISRSRFGQVFVGYVVLLCLPDMRYAGKTFLLVPDGIICTHSTKYLMVPSCFDNLGIRRRTG